jgi:hypothetical protein
VVDHYKYLGIDVCRNFSAAKFLKRLEHDVRSKAFKIARLKAGVRESMVLWTLHIG